MDQIEDPHELEREIERASRLASGITDQTTYQWLKQFVEELNRIDHHAKSETEGLSARLWNRNLAAAPPESSIVRRKKPPTGSWPVKSPESVL